MVSKERAEFPIILSRKDRKIEKRALSYKGDEEK